MITRHIFSCGRCHKPSPQPGRKRRYIRGLWCYVCAHCVGKEPKKDSP